MPELALAIELEVCYPQWRRWQGRGFRSRKYFIRAMAGRRGKGGRPK